jgi:hypothetical protein
VGSVITLPAISASVMPNGGEGRETCTSQKLITGCAVWQNVLVAANAVAVTLKVM